MSEEIQSAQGADKEARTMAMLAHLLGIFFGFIGPLVIWLIKKDEMPFVNEQGKEALNFQITILIGYIIAMVLMIIIIGALLVPVLIVFNLVFCIIGAVKANEGVNYRYPFALRLIK